MRLTPSLLAVSLLALMPAAANAAQEFYIGEPVVKENMQIVPNYLTGITMDKMPKGMEMGGADNVHLEADIHATASDTHGFQEDQWIPYLTVKFTLTKKGDAKFRKTGELSPMIAKDGTHYANNVNMAGPGTYVLTYTILPPSAKGFIRHTDAASGVPDWWKPITASWTFPYPSKTK
ncbi:MAG TPA: iron transporter [Rhizomicrobium sp.]|jgi:hypothetical protein|nr:iron transporter [Rhizomicrobium sp.]